jgi:glycosyltransferase involved in cell wall biosynthesis
MSQNGIMRVGYVLKRYPRYSETFIVNEILAHEAAGLQIEIFSLYPPLDHHFQDSISLVQAPVNYLTVAGAKFSDFWWGLEAAAQSVPGMWAALESAHGENPHAVYQAAVLAAEVGLKGIHHLHAHFGTRATSVARLAACFSGIPYSFTAHAKDIFHENVEPEDLRRKLHDAAAVVTVSDYNVEHLRSNFGPSAEHVRRVYNGLDLKNFLYEAPQDRPPRIVAVGRLVEKKGFSVLVDACAILASRRVPFECKIIGTGELEIDLDEQIKRLGLNLTVKLSGPRPQNEVVKLVRAASAIAVPCIVGADGNRDGLPTVLLEAMALGTPCVSTDVTGIPEVIRDGDTGLTVPQHDAAALAEALERLLTNSALRVELATRARHLVERQFDVHKNAARIRKRFRQAERSSVSAKMEVV